MDLCGSHISTNGNVLNALKNYYKTHKKAPVQIFAGSPQSFSRPSFPDFLPTVKEFIIENDLKVFIHSAYLVNIAKQLTPVAKKCLLYDLEYAEKIGSCGVVLHVGKSCELSYENALKNSIENITFFLKESKSNLLLETPAAAGSEMFAQVESFISFCKRFEEYDNFRICVDTCHVFAAGHNPIEYLETIYEQGLTIDLVHMNDSKEEKGSRKDRHEYIYQGKIGKEILDKCMSFCKEKGIPYLFE